MTEFTARVSVLHGSFAWTVISDNLASSPLHFLSFFVDGFSTYLHYVSDPYAVYVATRLGGSRGRAEARRGFVGVTSVIGHTA